MNRLSLALLLIIFSGSCEDIFVEDISDRVVSLVGPPEGLEAPVGEHSFWWENVPGATKYELIIASPDLVNPVLLALDTVITKNHFNAHLEKGDYQWCVSALNTEYATGNSCRNIHVTD